MVLSTERASAPFLLILLCCLSFCESFTSKFHTPTSFIGQQFQSGLTSRVQCYAKKGHSEFSVVDEDDEDDEGAELDFRQRKRGGGDLLIINEDAKSRQRSDFDDSDDDDSNHHKSSNPLEYAALRPGTVVQVQVGDLSLARKAWKKRRRTGSPLLVPCSVLNVDRRSAVRWNLIFLLEKFGQAGKGNKGGVVMSLKDLARTYRTYLKSSLGRQASALEFDSTNDMLRELFNKKIQESYGVFVEEKEETKEYKNDEGEIATSTSTMLYLTAPLNRRKAQQRSANPAMLQFRPPREGDYDEIGAAGTALGASVDQDMVVDDAGTLTHTGWIRAVKGEQENSSQREYKNFPLSACLRVSQKDDVDTGRVQEGKILPAVVFDFDKIGDGGSPLLTLSLNAASGGRQRLKIKPDRRYKVLKQKPKYQLNELSVGDGPYRAKVIKLIGNKQKALVDLGVGRELSSAGGSTVQVLATLRFKDSVELVEEEKNPEPKYPFVEFDDEEDYDIDDLISASIDELDALDDEDDEDYNEDEDDVADALLSLRKGSFAPGTFEEGELEEDISDQYTIDANGRLVFNDPETGETSIVDSMEEDDEEADDDAEDIVEDSDSDIDDDDDISDDDIAKLFSENEDGSITYNDPETGETMVVNEGEDEYELMMMTKSLIDDDLGLESPKIKSAESSTNQLESEVENDTTEETEVSSAKPKLKSKRLTVGEYIEVYISNVSNQSDQFRVTTNPLVKGQKAKDIKKDAGTKKKLNRLKKSFGGNLNRIYALKGSECEGIVKATSKTGDWVYVQPELENLPVGIGALGKEELSDLSAGDNVRVRISGIDEERGQLSMEVLSRV